MLHLPCPVLSERGEIHRLTVVFDLDGVVCRNGAWRDYSRAIPCPHGIAQINAAYDRGHYVVLQTARGMRAFQGDVARCYEKLYPVTFDWLRRHEVKFHELHFGKRSADLYVDDRGCRVESEKGREDWDKNFWPLLLQTEEREPIRVNY